MKAPTHTTTRTRKDGTKSRIVTLFVPLPLYNEIAEMAVKETRTISGQFLHYVKLGCETDKADAKR